MLSKNQVLTARKAVERLYTGVCTIAEYQSYRKANKSTGHHEVIVLEGQPCRLSHSSEPNADRTGSAFGLTESIKVFLPPEIEVRPGSKLTITQDGVTENYKNSGKPAVFSTHQEISLKLFEGWT